MKKLLILTITAVFFICTTNAFAVRRGEKIVYVDLKRVFQEFPETESATNELKEQIKTKQTAIDEKKTEVKKLREDYEKKAVVLSDEEKEKKSEEIDKNIKDLQDFVMKANRELKDIEEKLTREIIKKIQAAIDEVGKDEGYKMIFDKNERIVLFGSEDLDITDSVMKKLK